MSRRKKSVSTRQLEMFPPRGGHRKGAGRKPKGERAGVSHAARGDVRAHHPQMVTLKFAKGLPNLRANAPMAVITGAFELVNQRAGFGIVHFSVMGDHIHLMLEAVDRPTFDRAMISLNTMLARRLNKLWSRGGDVFPDRFHSQALTGPRRVWYALRYILTNARKHGLWRRKSGDPFSSINFLYEIHFPAYVPPSKGPTTFPYLTRPTSWLLSKGWRRSAPIPPAHHPPFPV